MDRFLALVRELGATPLFQVNARARDPAAAADLVRYVNIERRAGVQLWEVGNEVSAYMSRDEYLRLLQDYAQAMRGVDPQIRILASGRWSPDHPDWSLALASREADHVSEHLYAQHRSDPMLAATPFLSDGSGLPRQKGEGIDTRFGWNRVALSAVAGPPETLGLQIASSGFCGMQTVRLGEIETVSPDGSRRTLGLPRVQPGVSASLYAADSNWLWHRSKEVLVADTPSDLLLELPGGPALREVGLVLRAHGTSPPPLRIEAPRLTAQERSRNLLDDDARPAYAVRIYAYSARTASLDLPLSPGTNVLRAPLGPGPEGPIVEAGIEIVGHNRPVAGTVRLQELALEGENGRRVLIDNRSLPQMERQGVPSTLTDDGKHLVWTFDMATEHGEEPPRTILARRWLASEEVSTGGARELVAVLTAEGVARAPYGFTVAGSDGTLRAADREPALEARLAGEGMARISSAPLVDALPWQRLEMRVRAEGAAIPAAKLADRDVVPAEVEVGDVVNLLFTVPGTPDLGGSLEVPFFLGSEANERALLSDRGWRDRVPGVGGRAAYLSGARTAVTEYGAYAADPPPTAGGLLGGLLDALVLVELAKADVRLAAGFDLLDTTPYGLVRAPQPDGPLEFQTTRRLDVFRLVSQVRGSLVAVDASGPAQVAILAAEESPRRGWLVVVNPGPERVHPWVRAGSPWRVRAATLSTVDRASDGRAEAPLETGAEGFVVPLAPESVALVRLDLE